MNHLIENLRQEIEKLKSLVATNIRHGPDQGDFDATIGQIDSSLAQLEQAIAETNTAAEKALEELSEQAIQLQSEVARSRDMQSKLAHLTQYDPLTDLPNRETLFNQGENLLASARRYGHNLALFYINVDDFKGINSRYGRDLGDSILVELSMRMKESFREVDIVSRVGGNELVILLSQWEQHADITAVAERVLQSIHQPIESVDIDETLSASIGIALYPDHVAFFRDLMRAAEVAMRQSQNDGRNRYSFASSNS
jgi:diguanylate cyclase (GGDEF)-like protein